MEVGVKDNLKKKLARSSLTWAGHVERMGDKNKTGKESRSSKSGGEKRGKRVEIVMGVNKRYRKRKI